MILYFTPYDKTKNLGAAYNYYMNLVPEDSSACLMDGDTCFLVPDFGNIIEDYSAAYPESVLTCKTNRIHRSSRQLDGGQMDENCNMRDLIKKAEARKHLRSVEEIKPGEGLSGFLLVVPKKIWKVIPFIENGGCLGVDSQFRIDLHYAGIKTYIMEGLLVFHQYRLLNSHLNTAHLV